MLEIYFTIWAYVLSLQSTNVHPIFQTLVGSRFQSKNGLKEGSRPLQVLRIFLHYMLHRHFMMLVICFTLTIVLWKWRFNCFFCLFLALGRFTVDRAPHYYILARHLELENTKHTYLDDLSYRKALREKPQAGIQKLRGQIRGRGSLVKCPCY